MVVEVATNASGTEPASPFWFNIRAQRVGVDSAPKLFIRESREYSDGDSVQFLLSGFSKLEEGSPYVITVSCANNFGTSGDSNQLSVIIEFNTGIVKLTTE